MVDQGVVTPPPAAVAPPAAAAVATPTTETVNPGSWMAGFNDDQKAHATNKGWKGIHDAIDSHRNMEKLIGVPQDRLLKLPDRFYDDKGAMTPEGRQIYDRLGAPKEAKDYNLPMPKEGGDKALMDEFSKVFFEAGIPKTAAEKIATHWNEYQGKAQKAMQEQAAQRIKDDTAALQKDWGAALEQNTQICKEAALRLKMGEKEINALSGALGHAQTMKLLHKLGTSVSEHAFIQGEHQERANEPGTAKAMIKQLIADKDFQNKIAAGDADARAKWDKLHKESAAGRRYS